MKFKELYKKTLVGDTKVEVFRYVKSDGNGYTAIHEGIFTPDEHVPVEFYNGTVINIWPTEDKTLAVVVAEDAKHDKN